MFMKPGDTVQLLVRGDEAARVLDDWVRSGVEADLRVRRARTEGRVVIETADVLFASRVVRWFSDVRTAVKRK